jgi:hypothetical protein
MQKIDELLAHYGLILSECDEEWSDKVQEFMRVKSAMPENVAIKREQELVDEFADYHDVDEEPENLPKKPAVEKKKGRPAQKTTEKSAPEFEYDEDALLKKADGIIDELDD